VSAESGSSNYYSDQQDNNLFTQGSGVSQNYLTPSPTTEDVNDEALAREFEAFLERCDDEGSLASANSLRGSVSALSSNQRGLQVKPDQYGEAELSEKCPMGMSKSINTNSACPRNTNQQAYLNVTSAKIDCPKSSKTVVTNIYDRATNEKYPRIYHLALLFDELFSGGETPLFELRTISSRDGAFVSLPTSNEGCSANEDSSVAKEPKRRQDLSGLKKSVDLAFEYLKFMQIPGPLCHLIHDMLNCVYGDLGRGECYTNVRFVRILKLTF
jgi:hypothetical protein